MSHRVRVAALQYNIRPVDRFDEFCDQVSGLIATAADYECRLVAFPEYFTLQLLTLGDTQRPIQEQVRELASYAPRYIEMMSSLSKEHNIYVVGGTIPVRDEGFEHLYNDCFFFSPSGRYGVQGKLHMTRFEKEGWNVCARRGLKVFQTDFGRVAITVCYDVEFPELARAAARQGADILVVPSSTDERQGFYRVRYCAHARAIENQMYVIHAVTVGSLPMVPDVSLNFGQASILTPSDFPFARDGILAEGIPNQETMIIGELNMETIAQARSFGTVLPLNDSHNSSEIASILEVVAL